MLAQVSAAHQPSRGASNSHVRANDDCTGCSAAVASHAGCGDQRAAGRQAQVPCARRRCKQSPVRGVDSNLRRQRSQPDSKAVSELFSINHTGTWQLTLRSGPYICPEAAVQVCTMPEVDSAGCGAGGN